VIRDKFLQELVGTMETEGIAQLAVRAVIPFAGQVLLLKRRTDDYLGSGRWELPNGTVEPGEILGEALTRVVQQQTGLNVVAVRSHLGSSDYASASGQQVRQYNFVAEVVPTDEIKLAAHETYAWADLRKDPPVSAADQAVLSNFLIGLIR
jgi:8-oxo-dGTP diphosphatase